MAFLDKSAPGYKTVRQNFEDCEREAGPCETCGEFVDPMKMFPDDDDDDLVFWELNAECKKCTNEGSIDDKEEVI
jgi:hypothetical protein